MARERMDGFFVAASTLTLSQRALLAELAVKHRLPSMFGTRDNVEAGGLMSYAPDHRDLTVALRPTSTRSSRAPNRPTCR